MMFLGPYVDVINKQVKAVVLGRFCFESHGHPSQPLALCLLIR